MKAGLPSCLRNAHTMRIDAQINCKFFFYAISLFVFLFGASPKTVWANNLSISNVTLTSQDSANDTVAIQFDISWDNSWRNQTNWDAVWIFIKYTTETSTPQRWFHAILRKTSAAASQTNPSGYSQGSGTGLDILLPDDNTGADTGVYGAFLYRSEIGTGSVSTTSVKLLWDYGENGLADTATPIVQVFGIEMVYVPQAYFVAGDSTNSASNPPGGFVDGGSGTYAAYTVSSETQIGLGSPTTGWIQSRSGMSPADDFSSAAHKNLPIAYPKGYNAFYMMKYELTQGQYAEFLNTLERKGQVNLVGATVSADTIANYYVMSAESQLSRSNRNTITAPSFGNGSINPIAFSVSRPYRAMNYLAWMDLAAYADWAALRPMSELEYEKAARGFYGYQAPLPALSLGFAWGTTDLVIATTPNASEDSGTEGINGNAAYGNYTYGAGDGSTGPLRVGIFASGTATATRPLSGAGFYGAMELSGNVAEQVASITDTLAANIRGGRDFDGSHGNGTVVTGSACSWVGRADVKQWPGSLTTFSDGNCSGGGTVRLIYSRGAIRRGGSWSSVSARLQLSDRLDSGSVPSFTRSSAHGGRLVRTAP